MSERTTVVSCIEAFMADLAMLRSRELEGPVRIEVPKAIWDCFVVDEVKLTREYTTKPDFTKGFTICTPFGDVDFVPSNLPDPS